MINKKLFLIIISVSGFIVLALFAYTYLTRSPNTPAVNDSLGGIMKSGFAEIMNKVSPSSPIPSPIFSPTPTPFANIPDFTGAVNTTPLPLTPKETQFSNLVNKTPFNLGFAAVDMDYANNKFKVALVSPYLQSKQNFMTWLKDNGFGLITESDLEFSEN
ncbi:MAG: hypothetical protein ABSA43_01805 [Candidatus Microgenomates bacterium]|jgi:hypothetical protein